MFHTASLYTQGLQTLRYHFAPLYFALRKAVPWRACSSTLRASSLATQRRLVTSLSCAESSLRYATLRFTLNTTPALTRTCAENNFVCSERDSLEFIQHFRSKCYTIKKVFNNGLREVRGVWRFAPAISMTRVKTGHM